MQVSEPGEDLEVTTREASRVRSIGDALYHAYQGELEDHHSDGTNVVRVPWRL